MEVPGRILRRSIHTFLQNYDYFTITSAFIAFPFSLSLLLSQSLLPPPPPPSSSSSFSLLPLIYNRLSTLFDAAGFPSSSHLFTLFSLKASETIASSVFTFPFSLSFFLIAKASIFLALKNHPHNPTSPFSSLLASIISLYKPLLKTFVTNSFLIISANATSYCLLFFAFGVVNGVDDFSPNTLFLVSACGAVLFSVILANALVICNMAMAVSGMEGRGGCLAILKACVFLRGRTSMALFLALPVNLGLAAIEALFQFRVVRAFRVGGKAEPCMAMEGIFIAYLYSIFLVLDTIVACMFYKSCKMGSWIDDDDDDDEDEDGELLLRIEFAEEDKYVFEKTKNLEQFEP